MNSGIDDATGDATVQITLDGQTETVEQHRPLVEVAREHGSYVPGWCHHPSMEPASTYEAVDEVYRSVDGATTTPPRGVAALDEEEVGPSGEGVPGTVEDSEDRHTCIVEVDGELVRACETTPSAGMEVRTDSEEARARQEAAMAETFRHHPHACLNCPQKEGCDRISCSMNVPEEKRCCDLLGNCELEKSAEAIDLDWNEVPAYEPLERPTQKTAIFDINWELCIGCKRCVGVCEDHVGAGVWKFTTEDDADGGNPVTVGMEAEVLAKSGCQFCTSCAGACPTGALMDNDGADNPSLDTHLREELEPVQFPSSKLPFEADAIKQDVPNAGGVYKLYDEDGECIEINGVADLSAELLTEIEMTDAETFEYELDESFTTRETELIEQYVNEHGHMPGAGGGMDDLF